MKVMHIKTATIIRCLQGKKWCTVAMIAKAMLDEGVFKTATKREEYVKLTTQERRMSVCNALQRKIPQIEKVWAYIPLPHYKRNVWVYCLKRGNPAFESFNEGNPCESLSLS